MPTPLPVWREDLGGLRPMLATVGEAPLADAAWVYEPKYDGIRALASIEPAHPAARVSLWSRLGNEKTAQFPEIVRALQQYGRGIKAPVVIDGEIVALDAAGEPAGFQQLQGRIHLAHATGRAGAAAFIAFDILRDGASDLRGLSLTARRARLERVFGNTGSPLLRLSDFVAADGRELYRTALERGWEGLIAKRADSPYRSGRRSPDWMKLKLVVEQEFVIGGWTEPRGARGHFGALLLGVWENGALRYVGHTGAGFDGRELARVSKLLRPLETSESPFRVRPKPNERPHWVKPHLVAQVKFTEWTADDKLRHPTYMGLRDDVDPRSVRREPVAADARKAASRAGSRRTRVAPAGPAASDARAAASKQDAPAAGTPRATVTSGPQKKARSAGVRSRAAPRRTGRRRTGAPRYELPGDLAGIIDQLDAIQAGPGDGRLVLPGAVTLDVTNLRKVFWPQLRLTKGDLLRYYVQVAPVLLPVVADRPLIMKRFPNGITGKAFYQQRAPEKPPPGVRIEVMESDDEVPSRIIGGSLETLLYMAQIAAISQDPWFSRCDSEHMVDFVALDLDPMPGVSFETVLDVARWVRDELQQLGTPGCPKTSGSDGLHVYIPMPPETPYEAGLIFCQIIATMVASKHPKQATVERSVHARGARVYVDYLQNIHGKSLAAAYSARASEFAGASTPLTWAEVDAGVDRRDFTIQTLPHRLKEVGDLWAALRTGPPADLRAVERYAT